VAIRPQHGLVLDWMRGVPGTKHSKLRVVTHSVFVCVTGVTVKGTAPGKLPPLPYATGARIIVAIRFVRPEHGELRAGNTLDDRPRPVMTRPWRNWLAKLVV
jgi:hypothetical protein